MIKVIRSIQASSTYYEEKYVSFVKQIDPTHKTIFVDTNKKFQTHMGFGGAFTESAAVTLALASKIQQKEMLDAYFSEQGLNYNLGRTVIHSSDFSEKTRFYIPEEDRDLSRFDMLEDDKFINPMIKEALKRKPDLWLMSSIWTPLPFMKENQDAYYGGRLLPQYDELYAQYFIRYLKEMKKRGIHIDATTIQNEPEATQIWESCYFSAKDELRFARVLADALKREKMDTKLIIWDHNRDVAFERAHEVLSEMADQIWGVGYHWYVTEDSQNLSMIHDYYPNHHLLFTEGCVEFTNTALNSQSGGKDKWQNAEFYARNIIKDTQNHSEAFIDWNLILNEEGGPNHVGNFCEAPIMYDRQKGQIIYNPSYYFIGHFSKYIMPGAKRLYTNQTVDKDVYTTAYENPNGDVIIVILNEDWVKSFSLRVNQKEVYITLPKKSISTYIIPKSDL